MEFYFFNKVFITLQIQISDLDYSKGMTPALFRFSLSSCKNFLVLCHVFVQNIEETSEAQNRGKVKNVPDNDSQAATIKCALIKSNDISAGKCGGVFIFINKAWQTFFKGLVYVFAVFIKQLKPHIH